MGTTIGVVGTGNMGAALVKGWLAGCRQLRVSLTRVRRDSRERVDALAVPEQGPRGSLR